jgi:hypothetical protein
MVHHKTTNPNLEKGVTSGVVRSKKSRDTVPLKWRKKSTSMMGKETAANKNVQDNRLPWKDKSKVFSPQHGLS